MPHQSYSVRTIVGVNAIVILFIAVTLFSLSYGSTGFKPFYMLIQDSNPILELRFTRTIFAILTLSLIHI